jgi:hypothetical protein
LTSAERLHGKKPAPQCVLYWNEKGPSAHGDALQATLIPRIKWDDRPKLRLPASGYAQSFGDEVNPVSCFRDKAICRSAVAHSRGRTQSLATQKISV